MTDTVDNRKVRQGEFLYGSGGACVQVIEWEPLFISLSHSLSATLDGYNSENRNAAFILICLNSNDNILMWRPYFSGTSFNIAFTPI
jgi:hypothetical protein